MDDGSRDDTPMVCKKLKEKLSSLRYIFTGTNLGSARARNVGIQDASGEYILYFESNL